MDTDKTDQANAPASGQPRSAAATDPPAQELAAPDIDPATAAPEEDDEGRLPELPEEGSEAVGEGRLATGHAAIENAVRLAPTSPGVYRMLNAASDVLYVGKAKNVRKRLSSYARANAPQPARILRMIAATASVEIVSTSTETEALLLEANLIKQLRPRFNVQLRDDKSFPYILITGDHWAPQILKHRGAQSRPGRYFGPFASAGAVNRTITALQRAFLIRSCTDAFFESRTRPCLLLPDQALRRRPAPARSISRDYAELVREAKEFLSGRSRAVKEELAAEMEKAARRRSISSAPALYRDRLAALSAIQSHQGINPRSVEEADVFAIHQEGGYSCVEVFFFRTGQNWGNRAYFPRADRIASRPAKCWARSWRSSTTTSRRRGSSCCPTTIEDRELLAEALSIKSGLKVEVVGAPARREEGSDRARARQCARGARPQARRDRVAGAAAAAAGRDASACRTRRAASRSTTTATSRAPTRSAP